jgi:hypothetical protein
VAFDSQIRTAGVESLPTAVDDDGAVSFRRGTDSEAGDGCVGYGSGGVSVGLVVVDDAVGEDGVESVAAACYCGSAGGVGAVADDGDARTASWDCCCDGLVLSVG